MKGCDFMRAYFIAMVTLLLIPGSAVAANYQDNLGSVANFAAGGHEVTGAGSVNGNAFGVASVDVPVTGTKTTGTQASNELTKVLNLRSAYESLGGGTSFTSEMPEGVSEGVFTTGSMLIDNNFNLSLTGMMIVNTSSLIVNGNLNGNCNLVVIADSAVINGSFTGLLIVKHNVEINGTLTGNVYSEGDIDVSGVVNSMNCTPPTPVIPPPPPAVEVCPDGSQMVDGRCATPVVTPPTVVYSTPEVPKETPKETPKPPKKKTTPRKPPFVVKTPKQPKCSDGVFTITVTGKNLVNAKVLTRVFKSSQKGTVIKFKLNRGDLPNKGVKMTVRGQSKSKTFRIKKPKLCTNVKAKQKVAVTG